MEAVEKLKHVASYYRAQMSERLIPGWDIEVADACRCAATVPGSLGLAGEHLQYCANQRLREPSTALLPPHLMQYETETSDQWLDRCLAHH